MVSPHFDVRAIYLLNYIDDNILCSVITEFKQIGSKKYGNQRQNN